VRRAEAELRQVTVLFCDLVSSTSLSNRLDLEEFREVIHSFQTTCGTVIRRFEGTISRYMGDGMLVLFGFPIAQEDAAERAVRAGLGMVQAVGGLRAPVGGGEPLAIRVGIATGLVLVGDLIGEGAAEEEAVLGEAPNLAARLQGFASPNSVVISSSTRCLVGDHFVVEDLGAHAFKGFTAPVPVWRVLGTRPGGRRFQAARAAQLTPLVGRDSDLDWLLTMWRSADQGRGRVALVVGEAGIGKSRLVEALRERVADESSACLQYQCSPQFVNRALHPVIECIENSAALSHEDSESSRLRKLSDWLKTVSGGLDGLSLLASLLSIGGLERGALMDMSAQLQKKLTFELLLQLMEPRTINRPLLIVFEDLHWADHTTLEFLTQLLARAENMAVLVVLTFRSGFSAPWQGVHVERRELQRLSLQPACALVERVAGEARMPRAVIEQLVAKTDGIPLYLEELTYAVLGSGVLDADPRSSAASQRLPALAIPSTLQDSLMARLDQLGPAKAVAQLASAVGRTFSYALLEAVAPLPRERLRQGLEALEQAGLIYAESAAGKEGYAFKHALLQDAAYQTLLRVRRRELHTRIAEVLEERFPQMARDAPELVAHHWTEGGDATRAVGNWLMAGKRASARSEYVETIGHLRRGLELVSKLGDSAYQRSRELELILALGPALIITEGAGNPEVSRLYARALELCSALPQSNLHFAAHWGWWRASMDHRSGRERADALLRLAEGLGDSEAKLQAHHGQWATLYMLGAHQECCRHIEAGLQAYDPDRHRSHAGVFGGHDAKVCGLGERALAYWLIGRVDEAVEHVRSSLAWAQELSHVGSRVHALDYALVLHKFRRDAPEVLRWARELVSYATEQHLRDHLAKGLFFRGWARVLLGDAEGGMAEMREALASEQDAGTPEDFPLYFEMLGEICARAGSIDEGLAAIDEGFSHADRGGIVYWNAELHRRRGELLLASRDDPAAAEVCFQEALTCARSQEARSLELRAAVSLARFYRDHGDSTAAVSVLRPVYGVFSQGFGTIDLIEAQSLLEAES
jgi:predicted ATPase/class 3 adenylate cyclase